MALPDSAELPKLLQWQPPLGILSLYLTIDHGNRGGSWWIAAEDQLRASARSAESADPALAKSAEAACERARRKLGDREHPPEGRGVVGFLELSSNGGEDRWHTTPIAPRPQALARIAPRPYLEPLVELLDDNRRRGVVLISSERARLLEWSEEGLRESVNEEILTTGDWRERKGRRNVNVPGGQAPTSSGKDLHEQRLDHHRHGFVKHVCELVKREISRRGWQELVCFGEAKHLADLEELLPEGCVAHSEDKNLIAEAEPQLLERLDELKDALNRRREGRLLDRAEGAALAGERGALGLREVAESLIEGRVEHLLLAPEQLPGRASEEVLEQLALTGPESELPVSELLLGRALATDAAVTPVEGEVAERLAQREGVAALLRY